MQVILLEHIDNLGLIGDVVEVKTGFARNFLLPSGKALRANKQNIAYFEGKRAQIEAENLKRIDDAKKVAGKMSGLTLTLIRQASVTDVLYGSVSNRDIATAITEQGFTIDRRQVILNTPIKIVGIHKVIVALHPEVKLTVTVNIAKSNEDAKSQLIDDQKILASAALAGEQETESASNENTKIEAEEPKTKKKTAKKSASTEIVDE